MTGDFVWRAYEASMANWRTLEAKVSVCAHWFVAVRSKGLEKSTDFDELANAVNASAREMSRSVRLAAAAKARSPAPWGV